MSLQPFASMWYAWIARIIAGTCWGE